MMGSRGPDKKPNARRPVPQLPGRALLWLIAAFVLLLVPQWDRLPLWLPLACVGLAGWRWLVHLGRLRLPGRWFRGGIMLVMISAYLVTINGGFTVDTAASFFVIAVGLKWIETRTPRDFYVLFFILTYLAAVNFLFEQGMIWTLLNFAGVMFLLIGLQILNAPDVPNALMGGWRRLLGMFVKTLPIVVLLFLFFPRLAPLWSVPLVSGSAKTGMSDSMTPGDISNLAQSSERAFRVAFGGTVPIPRDRYWRGLVLDQLDGNTWRQSRPEPYQRLGRVMNDGGVGELGPSEYDVLMEPTGQNWAFALKGSAAASANVYESGDDLFRFRRPADTPVRYRLSYGHSAGAPGALTSAEFRQFLQLPSGGNLRTRALADRLRRENPDAAGFIDQLLTRFREEPYFYTLRPPKMTGDSIDQLLFDARRGFCAHYAGATTFLLRAAGIPARIVTGYQGGEAGAGGDYLIIRQYDAHAWVEAWLPGQGWLRIDPTAAIAPDRIEMGLQQAVADEGSFLENSWTSPQRYGDVALIRWASLQLDKINYQWQRWVVGYQGQTQLDLLSRLPGHWGLKELGYFSAGLVAAGLLLAGVLSALRQRALVIKDPFARITEQWHQLLLRHGIEVMEGETPRETAERVARAVPAAAAPARSFARALYNHYYVGSGGGESGDQAKERDRLKRLLRATRKQLNTKN
ncbi:transglutaminase family protein [Marinobacter mobilis]|uniref:transglutaminase family protein n=1 Tax=Marinobacter mobilis TaxID=488533 RepID=UPI0035C6F0DA